MSAASMSAGNRAGARAPGVPAAEFKVALVWLGICAASCLMALATALWAGG